MPSLPDNYFRELPPAALITAVGSITLATISTWDVKELQRLGWLNNPIIDILYSMTSAGVWIARTDASGYPKMGDYYNNSSHVANQYSLESIRNDEHVTYQTISDSTKGKLWKRVIQIPLTEAAGSIAATPIVPALASFKGHCLIRKIWAPVGTTDAANEWTISSEAGGGITGPSTFSMAITALRNHWVDAGAAGVSGEGILVYNTTANKAIQISAANLANVGTTYYLEVLFWYEA